MSRRAEWAVILGALVYALLYLRFEWGGAAAYVLALLPASLTYLAVRSVLAAAVVFLLPMYFVIGRLTANRPHYQPLIWLDDAMPLWPVWSFVYLSLYLCAFLIPIIVVRGRPLVPQTLKAYLCVMLVSYTVFWIYPTTAPHNNQTIAVNGLADRALQLIYDIDQPYGCFPSLHVAYSIVGAFACYRMRPRLGRVMLAWAALIAVSTVYTKQHFVVDALAGAALAILACVVFLRRAVTR